jgi:hypothetical protein
MLKTIMLGVTLLAAAAVTPASAAMHAHGGGHGGFHGGHGGFHGGFARGGNFHGGRGFGGGYGYSYGGYGGGCPWPLLATGVCPYGYGYY